MISKEGGAPFVSICYFFNGRHTCEILPRKQAYILKKSVTSLGGTIYWFNPANG